MKHSKRVTSAHVYADGTVNFSKKEYSTVKIQIVEGSETAARKC